MKLKTQRIYIKVDEPLDTDPDSTNACVFKEDGKYYKVCPTGDSPDTVRQESVWKVRDAVRILDRHRTCESLLIPSTTKD